MKREAQPIDVPDLTVDEASVFETRIEDPTGDETRLRITIFKLVNPTAELGLFSSDNGKMSDVTQGQPLINVLFDWTVIEDIEGALEDNEREALRELIKRPFSDHSASRSIGFLLEQISKLRMTFSGGAPRWSLCSTGMVELVFDAFLGHLELIAFTFETEQEAIVWIR